MKVENNTRVSDIGRVLFLVFLISGVSSLICEIVWLRMLIRVFGVTVHAVSTILIVFMGGLALGSFFGHRLVRQRQPLLIYALVEFAIAIAVLVCTGLMDVFPSIFSLFAHTFPGDDFSLGVVRFLMCCIVLFPPTFLMGTTLPVVSSFLEDKQEEIGFKVGLLYGCNTLGAVLGVVLSGFVLLSLIGEKNTIAVAVILDTICGLAALRLAKKHTHEAHTEETSVSVPSISPETFRVFILYAVSGFCALALQVLWSRMLIVVLGSSVYGFSSMLAVYLTGIAAGSYLMAKYVDRLNNLLLAFAVLEIVNAVLAVVSLETFARLGEMQSEPFYAYSAIWTATDVLNLPLFSILIVFPTTFVLGAIFPVVSKLCLNEETSVGATVGRLYGYNTIGAIVGSFVSGFVLIPVLGTFTSFLIISSISLAIGLYVLWLESRERGVARIGLGAIGIVLFALMLVAIGEDPFLRVVKSRMRIEQTIVTHEEDGAATVTVIQTTKGEDRTLLINGRHVSGTGFSSRFMSILPLTLHPEPKESLIIALGVGEAFRGSVDYGVKTTLVELASSVRDVFWAFEPRHKEYLEHQNVDVRINDGRNFVLQTEKKFDMVLVDISPPIFASGMVNLYAREFSQMVSNALTDNGIFALWIPTNSFEDDFWRIAKGFCDVFPHVKVWSGPTFQGTFLFGTKSPNILDVSEDVLASRFSQRKVANLPRTPSEMAKFVQQSWKLSDAELRDYVQALEAVTDDRPYAEFPLFRFLKGERLEGTNSFLQKARTEEQYRQMNN